MSPVELAFRAEEYFSWPSHAAKADSHRRRNRSKLSKEIRPSIRENALFFSFLPSVFSVGPCALEYTKMKTADHFWTDPSADELVQRHRIHSGHCRQDSPTKRPALCVSANEQWIGKLPSSRHTVLGTTFSAALELSGSAALITTSDRSR